MTNKCITTWIIIYVYLSCINAQNNQTADLVDASAKPRPKVCNDVRITIFEVRRGLDLQALASCEIVLGSIIFAPMPLTTNTSTTPIVGTVQTTTATVSTPTSAPIRFPYLREVYGYILLGYSSIRSFSSMFPRLSVIHGRELYHGYALIVMENLQLDDLGLTSLINIRRGNIIIARNAQLCYAKSIRWNDIIENKKTQVILRQNRDDCAICPTCPSACWSATLCQQQCSTYCKGNCLSEQICCPDECVGGCYYQNVTASTNLVCNACRNLRIYATGKCVQQCPSHMLKVVDSMCVTRKECTSFFMGVGYILDETNQCVSACPTGFDLISGTRCVRCISTPENNYCHGACREQHIRSISDFNLLKYCSRVHTLNIYNIAAVESTENNLVEVFGGFASLEQIDHEFTVHNVNVFSTLGIFVKLKRIGISSNATITIEENDFLSELWPLSHPPPVLQGSLNIVRNARLCLRRIEAFVNYTTSLEKDLQIINNTFNEYANGYLASCESNLLTLSVEKIRSLTALIVVAVPKQLFFRSGGKADYLRRPFLSVYYKATQTRNETHFDATQSHKWLRIVEKVNYNPSPHGGSFTMRVELSSLLGATWYAVYASITSNVNTVGLYSTIGYFRTLPRQPEPVLNLRGDSLSSTSIELMWQPPSKPNGVIKTYIIYYAPIEDRLPVDNSKILCLLKDRWHAEVPVPSNPSNVTTSTRCPRLKLGSNNIMDNNDDDMMEEHEENTGIDQVVTDLAILEHQLINSVTQRKDPLFIRPDLKDTIINDLDHYFEDKSSSLNEQYKADISVEQKPVEHTPYINTFNRTTSATRVIIDDLKYAQMYMFQVFACHNIVEQSKSDACSLNGIIISVRTKPGDPSLDLVRDVQLVASIDNSMRLSTDMKTVGYQISWLEPLTPNGLVYFYTVHVDQYSLNGPKEERCVGHNFHSINVSLLPKTHYRLRIVTYTIARLNHEYGDHKQLTDDSHILNSTNLYFQLLFTTVDLPNREAIRQNRLALFMVIIGSIVLLLSVILGAPLYYYKYSRNDNKASISKNPNYELYTPDQWEIDKDSVTLDKLIGQGHFGQVYQGVLKLSDGTLKSCAVKIRTTHPTDLLQEASIMKQFQCYHVIQLYGICSRIRPPYVVMELMENGDLKNYLYRYRQSELNPNGPMLTESAMIQLALDIADGMYYLSDQKFVHRDLAARNCLVNGNHTCKVGDFGLTRDIYETDYYRRGGRSFLPIRWMAPESLRDGRFDTVSDVWSFGVLLWEIATLAEQPYQGYGNEEVVHYVRYGNITLERPLNCPEILHKLMRACWTFSPGDRISFRSIVDELIPYENEDFHLHAYYHTQPNQTRQTSLLDSSNNDEEELLLADEIDDDNDNSHNL
ncbi:unnamed protein product [Adineta ricciae]|uniref:Tyrosine-protein kinase receptor n=1 Tax=Adineta ricciae TaxID=249248 RepID=A0A813NSW4_ADIRI|nr:unnamed protein product [Adineta ricciae]CAF0999262.1 unnamed protein product [Adineta ricciae]